jgi:hypothetical protein
MNNLEEEWNSLMQLIVQQISGKVSLGDLSYSDGEILIDKAKALMSNNDNGSHWKSSYSMCTNS